MTQHNHLARIPGPHTPGHHAVRSVSGFTLVELMVVVSIIAVLAAIAAPAFSDMIAGAKAKGAATDLYVALTRARSEAVKRNTNVTLSATGGEWIGGWNIYPSDAESNILESHGALQGVAITGSAAVQYNSSGRLTGLVDSFGITATSGSSVVSRCVTIGLSGLPSVKASAC